MNNKIALSIEQMQHLRELGLDCSGASMHWQYIPTADNIMGKDDSEELALFISGDYKMQHCYPAFCLQDILELLSKVKYDSNGFPMFMMVYNQTFSRWEVLFRNPPFTNPNIYSESPLDAAYDMLCWCIDNGYIKTKNKEV